MINTVGTAMNLVHAANARANIDTRHEAETQTAQGDLSTKAALTTQNIQSGKMTPQQAAAKADELYTNTISGMKDQAARRAEWFKTINAASQTAFENTRNIVESMNRTPDLSTDNIFKKNPGGNN